MWWWWRRSPLWVIAITMVRFQHTIDVHGKAHTNCSTCEIANNTTTIQLLGPAIIIEIRLLVGGNHIHNCLVYMVVVAVVRRQRRW